MQKKQFAYKPILFIAITFAVTWACTFFLAYQPWFRGRSGLGAFIIGVADFLKSASPLLAALILLRKPLFQERGLFRFLFGFRASAVSYFVVAALFIYQFFTFFLFRLSVEAVSFSAFLGAWGGQLLFGGGMEEGGWRAYLQPSLEKHMHVVLSVLAVGVVWSAWHLPYFFLPGTFQTGSNFLFYTITTTAIAFTLTAIYKLTGSVLLCTLFHGWQNAIVMNFQANMAHLGFLIMFLLQTAVSIWLCVKPLGQTDKA